MEKPKNEKFISVELKEAVEIYDREYTSLNGVLFKDGKLYYRDLPPLTDWNNVKEWRYASPMEV